MPHELEMRLCAAEVFKRGIKAREIKHSVLRLI